MEKRKERMRLGLSDSYGADGFNIMPATLPGTFKDFAELVVPELQRRGRFRFDYEGTPLRDHLGVSIAQAATLDIAYCWTLENGPEGLGDD
jgi:hypothetical protein